MPWPVRVGQRVRHFPGDSDRLDGELALPLEPLAKGLALDIGHHVVEEPGRLARVVQRQDVGVLEVGGDLHFVDEALYADRGGQVPPEDLDCDLAAMPSVPGEVHVCHSAFAQLALDFVAIGEGSPELLQSLLFQQINHRNTPQGRSKASGEPVSTIRSGTPSSSLGMAMSVAEAL